MSEQNVELVSVLYTQGHVVCVSDAVDPASPITIVSIVPKGEDGNPKTSDAFVVTVCVDATDGSLNIQTTGVGKVGT